MEPILNLKRCREVSFDRCIICQEKSSARSGGVDLSVATATGIDSLRQATELRQKLRDCDFREAVDRLVSLFNEESDLPTLLYHRLTCYARYTNKQKINKKNYVGNRLCLVIAQLAQPLTVQ